ncbi:cytochrome b/b6 domain-containing protein [Idiomarina seosinensis]|uniref:cytochrome b/b6 domain-containing protein n=1 Tax=Idiomarina seosinensis TaxID=281739 RepID=UPI001F53E811|nr:cytochrome b/b6 domain-containing protein [Idiomarina seosinensis]
MVATAVKVWDRFVRCYHWLIVVAFSLNYFLLEPGEQVHQWVGYSAFSLIAIRIVWGFIGPDNARISSFFPTPTRLRQHFCHLKQRQLPKEQGHNPLGGLLILLFWLLFLAQGITGFLLEETDYFFGSSLIEAIHGLIADALFVGVLIHVCAVIIMGWWGRIQLIRPMLTGKRR